MDIFSYMLGKKTGGIPSDYKDAEYIESTGTQYIDTGIIPNNTFKIEAKFQQTTRFKTYPKLFGSEIEHANQSIKLDIGQYESNPVYITFYYLDKEYRVNGNTYDRPHIFKFERNKVSWDDTDTTFEETGNLNSGMNLYLFAANRNNSAIEFGALKLYYCKIWQDGVMVRDYVPKFNLKTYKFGLYDNISGTFYENDGTGSFSGE